MATIYFTDSCADLPQTYCKQHKLNVLSLTYKINDRDYADDFGQSMSIPDFYEQLRMGNMASTSQINSSTFLDAFRTVLDRGDDVFYLAFSSALSGTYNSAMMAREELIKEFPERKIFIWDSKAASMGQGLMMHYVLRMRDSGETPDAIIDWLKENTLNFAHWFTVADLNHLRRGGRVTAASAFLGTMLNIKPVLHVDNEGYLVPMEKVKGRSRSLRALVDHVEKSAIDPASQTMFISHSDSLSDAELVASMIKERFGTKDFLINYIGPTIGSHTGADTISLFFLAKER